MRIRKSPYIITYTNRYSESDIKFIQNPSERELKLSNYTLEGLNRVLQFNRESVINEVRRFQDLDIPISMYQEIYTHLNYSAFLGSIKKRATVNKNLEIITYTEKAENQYMLITYNNKYYKIENALSKYKLEQFLLNALRWAPYFKEKGST